MVGREAARVQDQPDEKQAGRYHHGNLAQALIDASLVLVAEKGPAGFTLREVARRAGVTHAAPYRHFTDKASLLAAVAEQGFVDLRRDLERARDAERSRSATARLLAAGAAYVRFAVAHPSHFRVMFGPEADKAEERSLREAARAAFHVLLDGIRAGQAAGELRAGEPLELAHACWSLVHGLASLVVAGQIPAREPGAVDRLAAQVMRLMETGLRRERGEGPGGLGRTGVGSATML